MLRTLMSLNLAYATKMADIEDETTRGKSFRDLSLDSWIVKQCESLGINQPTPVQFQCIPAVTSGRDCIGCAKTGSGKTLAFALPILQRLWEDPHGIFALVLTPTRELAFQIADQFQVMGKPMGTRVTVVVGRMSMVEQAQAVERRPHVVIATPGRLSELMSTPSCALPFQRLRFLVLDEADMLLNGDYDTEVNSVLAALPRRCRQTLLFTATASEDALPAMLRVANTSQSEDSPPFVWMSQAAVATVGQLLQEYVLCPPDVKDGYLVHVLQNYQTANPKASIIIFTNSCKNCQVVSMTLSELGFDNGALHSMLSQRERLATLAKFRSSQVRILVSTDLASRGLDIPTVELVLNHNVPMMAKNYVHRVGRTARAGRGGQSITMVTPRDIKLLHAIEDHVKTKLTEHKVKDQEVVKILTQVLVTRRESQVKLDADQFDEKRRVNKRKQLLLDGIDPEEEELKKIKEAKRRRKEKKMKHSLKSSACQPVTDV